MTEQELLDRCQRLSDVESAKPWTSDSLGPFFQQFRPSGAGLEELFAGVGHGDKILRRLRQVYKVAGETEDDFYFVVRKPQSTTRLEVAKLCEDHLQRMRALAAEGGINELVDLLDPLPKVQIVLGDPPRPPAPGAYTDLACLISESIGDFIRSLEPSHAEGLILREAFYYIACNFMLRDYLLWPIYQPLVRTDDPFLPEFALWQIGAHLCYPTNDDMSCHVSADVIGEVTQVDGRNK